MSEYFEHEYYFTGYRLIGPIFELTDEEKQFFVWEGCILKLTNEESDEDSVGSEDEDPYVARDFLQSKTNHKIPDYNCDYNNTLFSYFFAANKQQTNQKLSRTQKHFYLLGFYAESNKFEFFKEHDYIIEMSDERVRWVTREYVAKK